MAVVEMIMPKMGESIFEGTILTWLKKEGEEIAQDESVLEVATDKVDTEVPALHGGVLKKILVKEGEVAEVGAPIALIETSDENAAADEQTTNDDKMADIMEAAPPNTASLVQPSSRTSLAQKSEDVEDARFYSPLVLSIAKKEQISKTELAQIPGTGREGRVTKDDMFHYLNSKKDGGAILQEQPRKVLVSGEDEVIQMDRMRRVIAQRMLDSKRISAHVSSFVEADVTNIVLWRNKIKEAYKQKEGESFTFTPIFVQAIAKALKEYPMINIAVDGEKIIKKKAINIGIAVALPNGNLIVPVIKNADNFTLNELSKKINDVAKRARNNKLDPDELTGGTYTLSNVGSFGNIMGTPIIVQPQVAIMAVGTIVKKPAVIETPTGDVIGIRHKMFLSHSYDHRVVDGALGGMFVKRVADHLEEFSLETKLTKT
ncbi:dihydrolipoamide acetyltransferase family protein [Pleomorphovibrio marinus]|uniref:dihydrolipoamide acetyltransferase family protein n=1 Tax=Pleomorphovibrio marinus TaxID=2164132 RepID=UPI000E0B0E27|nr:dihydrolipoamide acetyltransferase family protein [Pleomorphovibrio marinus]